MGICFAEYGADLVLADVDTANMDDAAATIEALYDSNYGLPVEQEAGLNPETRRRHEAAAAAKGAASR